MKDRNAAASANSRNEEAPGGGARDTEMKDADAEISKEAIA